jgi:hypothetical protein
VKSTLYLTAQVLPGNKIELQNSNLTEGQIVEVIVIISQSESPSSDEASISLSERKNFLKLPLDERRRILSSQAEAMVSHYEENSDWKELLAGDVIEY